MDHVETTETNNTTNTHLVFLAIVLSILNTHLSTILNYVFILTGKITKSTHFQQLKEQLIELQKEGAGINMTDEFAKYAKLQRKITKIKEELKKEANAENESNMKKKLILRIIIGMCCIYLMYNYNSQPVIHLPSDAFFPITFLLSWPGAPPGSISFLVWCAITNSVVRTFS